MLCMIADVESDLSDADKEMDDVKSESETEHTGEQAGNS